MVSAVEVSDAQTRLSEIVLRVGQGEEIVLTEEGKPVAKVVAARHDALPRIPGLHTGNITYISDDFDDPLPDEFWLGQEP